MGWAVRRGWSFPFRFFPLIFLYSWRMSGSSPMLVTVLKIIPFCGPFWVISSLFSNSQKSTCVWLHALLLITAKSFYPGHFFQSSKVRFWLFKKISEHPECSYDNLLMSHLLILIFTPLLQGGWWTSLGSVSHVFWYFVFLVISFIRYTALKDLYCWRLLFFYSYKSSWTFFTVALIRNMNPPMSWF